MCEGLKLTELCTLVTAACWSKFEIGSDWTVTVLVLGTRKSGKTAPTNVIVMDHTSVIRIVGWDVPNMNSSLQVAINLDSCTVR